MNKAQCVEAVAEAFGLLPRRVQAVVHEATMTVDFFILPGPMHFTEAEIMEHKHEARQNLPVHLLVRIEVLQ